MSNAESRANFDGYIATAEPLEINQVIPVGEHRAYVVHRFPCFAEWEAARTTEHRSQTKEFEPGYIKAQTRTTRRPIRSKPAPPPTAGYFYGVNWLPEERPPTSE